MVHDWLAGIRVADVTNSITGRTARRSSATAEALTGAGYTMDKIAALAAEGVIRP